MAIPSTLTEQIKEARKLEISYKTLHDSCVINNKQDENSIEIPFSSITNKYRVYLNQSVVQIQLTEEEERIYMYNPKMLSLDLYGTVEFWSDLLKLNNAVSILDFKPSMVKIYNPSSFKQCLNEILMGDADYQN